MIRPAIPEDTAKILAFTEALGLFRPREIQAIADQLTDLHAGHGKPDHQAVVFEQDGEPIAFAYFAPAPLAERAWYLHWLVVRQDQQCQGIGNGLLQYVENEIRHLHQGRILLVETGGLPTFARTRQFYLQRNYQQMGVVNDYFDDGDDLVIVRKRLNY